MPLELRLKISFRVSLDSDAKIENLPAHLLRLRHTPAEREPFRLPERSVNLQ